MTFDSSTPLRLSILDLAPIGPNETAKQSFENSVAIAQTAERHGYQRVWYAEHHNMATIASSATSVLIGHVASQTSTIRLGSGGIMLPNHAPLAIAEQFGTLATLYPDRIDLGLGRAPGSDQVTMRAMRRDPMSADSFPQDVRELHGYLGNESLIPGVKATPGAGTNVPLYILGSSMFGAQLAAAYGLPYAFASHFAPDLLERAISYYRDEFTPSAQLAEPYVIAGVNVVAANTAEAAQEQYAFSRRRMVRSLMTRPGSGEFDDQQIDAFLASPSGSHIAAMGKYAAIGTPDEVSAYLEMFREQAQADELILNHQSAQIEDRLTSITLTAKATALSPQTV